MSATSRIFAAFFVVLASAVPSLGSPALVFSPPQWNFGSILKGEKIQTVVTVKNTGETDAIVGLAPTCTCNTVTPPEQLLKAGSEGTFIITFDSSDDTGITRKDFLIKTKPAGLAPLYYTSIGIVRAERQASAGP